MPLNVYASLLPVDAAKKLGSVKALGRWGVLATEYATKLGGRYWFVRSLRARNVKEHEVPQRAVKAHNNAMKRRARYASMADTLARISNDTLSRNTICDLLYKHLDKDIEE